MKELKDIVLKKGDIVEFEDGTIFFIDIFNQNKNIKEKDFVHGKVVKIERPTRYETIYEAPKQILDKEEKEYLEAVIRPFRDRMIYISKEEYADEEYVSIVYGGGWTVDLPNFSRGTMYKGMELNKEYTLDELGLFKE